MDVSLITDEKVLPVKYGMFDLGPIRDTALTSWKYILTDLTDIKKSYIRLGFHLLEFERCEYYKDFGYLTFADFYEANIPLDQSSISRCMSVCDNFCVRDSPFSSPKMFLADEYKDYSYSQLCEMVSMKDDVRKQVKPEMSVKQIRQIKKDFLQNKKNVSQDYATSHNTTRLCVTDLCNKKGIVLQNHIKKCEALERMELVLYDENGKEAYIGEFDVLLTGEIGSKKKYHCRIVKNMYLNESKLRVDQVNQVNKECDT